MSKELEGEEWGEGKYKKIERSRGRSIQGGILFLSPS